MTTKAPKGYPEEDNTSRGKNQPRRRRRRSLLPVVTALINFAGFVAVAWGVWVANKTLHSIDESVAIAGQAVDAQIEQLTLSHEQFTAGRDALWLDQRPWLAFSKAETIPNAITQHDGVISFRLHILNSGKTPAFNVRLLQSRVEFRPNTASFAAPSPWMPTSHPTRSVFPNDTGYYTIDIPSYIASDYMLSLYAQNRFNMAVAARLEYCDANRSLHWTQLGVAKVFSETELIVKHSTASLHPGSSNDADCQEEAPG